MKSLIRGTIASCALVVAGCSGTAADDQAAVGAAAGMIRQCQALTGQRLAAYVVVRAAAHHPADAATGLPAFCEVEADIRPVPESRIVSVFRLPYAWNGRMLGLGGGGWDGQTALLPPRPNVLTASLGLPRGYAVVQTDAGHPAGAPTKPSWVTGNPAAVTDFSHRAIHETALAGKLAVLRFYGKPPARSYFQGCSTGGRMAMMETQRYPRDYDGVVAGAPVYDLMVQTSAVVRDQIFRAPGAAISRAQLEAVNRAVLAACDGNDGLPDGVVADPQSCSWQPAAMRCGAGTDPATCLTDAQVQALERAYATVRSPEGRVGHYGLARGGEAGWNPFVPTTAEEARHAANGDLGALVPLIFPAGGYEPAAFDVARDQAAVHATPFADEYEAASTDLAAFFGRGGRLILWHGLDDPGPSALATQDYYQRVVERSGPQNLRYYPAPGVYHCGGGPGAYQMDLLGPMRRWVELGEAPGNLVARTARQAERPLCAWPGVPRYQAGDPNVATSFRCE